MLLLLLYFVCCPCDRQCCLPVIFWTYTLCISCRRSLCRLQTAVNARLSLCAKHPITSLSRIKTCVYVKHVLFEVTKFALQCKSSSIIIIITDAIISARYADTTTVQQRSAVIPGVAFSFSRRDEQIEFVDVSFTSIWWHRINEYSYWRGLLLQSTFHMSDCRSLRFTESVILLSTSNSNARVTIVCIRSSKQ